MCKAIACWRLLLPFHRQSRLTPAMRCRVLFVAVVLDCCLPPALCTRTLRLPTFAPTLTKNTTNTCLHAQGR